MKNLIDFDEPPTTSKPSTKTKEDLIPTTSKPSTKTKEDLIPTTSKPSTKKIDDLMSKNVLDFARDPYKQLSRKQSPNKIKTEVINAFLNEINYPLTKDILGINLT